MKRMRLLVLSTLMVSGAFAQNLNLDSWSNATTATSWTSTLDGYEMLIPGEEPPVNEATGFSGSCARLNPIDLSTLQSGAPVISIFGLGTDNDADLLPDGMSYTTRVESIDFQAKFTVSGDAVAVIESYMINGTDTLGVATTQFASGIPNFTAQNVAFTYDPQFDGIAPERLVLLVALIGTDSTSTTADFYVDQFALNDIDNTGLSDLDKDSWKVSTANGNIIVSGVENGEVAIYSAAGQVVATGTVENGQAVINASNLASGITMVTLNTGKQIGTKKIIL